MPSREVREVNGLRQLGANMRALSEAVNKRLARGATGRAANVIKTRAKRKVLSNPSVDTGSLEDAIVAKKATKGETYPLTSMHLVAVRIRQTSRKKRKGKQATAPYAPLVEFGTVKMAAEPFMRPAFDEGKNDALETMVETLRKGIERETAKLPK